VQQKGDPPAEETWKYTDVINAEYGRLKLWKFFYISHILSSMENVDAMEERRKIAAATAAVLNYIVTEEEAICIQAMAAPPGVKPAPVPSAAAPVRLWGVSGRQAQMQMRNLMQMRTFK